MELNIVLEERNRLAHKNRKLEAEIERLREERDRWKDRALTQATGYKMRAWERADADRAAEKGARK